jgi:FkbM family methyltransferase
MFLREKVRKIKKWGIRETSLRIIKRIIEKTLQLSRFFRPKFYFWFVKKNNPGFAIKEINGCKMYLDLKNDIGISRELYIYSKREHATTDFALNTELIRKGNIILDIGTNIGYYALIWSKLVGDKGKVYALEPVENNFRVFKKNIELNNINNIDAFNVAAGSENGKDYINVAEAGNISSFINGKYSIKNREEVNLVKIDDFLKNKDTPTIVRMDVEGYAGEILKGMEKTLKNIKYILVEIHPHIKTKRQKEEFASILTNNNFKVERIFIDTNTSMPNKGIFPSLMHFVDKKIYNSKSMQQRLKNINKKGNLGLVFKEGGYSILFSKDAK